MKPSTMKPSTMKPKQNAEQVAVANRRRRRFRTVFTQLNHQLTVMFVHPSAVAML